MITDAKVEDHFRSLPTPSTFCIVDAKVTVGSLIIDLLFLYNEMVWVQTISGTTQMRDTVRILTSLTCRDFHSILPKFESSNQLIPIANILALNR